MELFADVLLDSVADTLELVPFLFLTYLAMEALEHSTEGKVERVVRRAGRLGPAVGGLLGALPQCGFSAMAATLYAGRVVTAGTLVAVILSTSDELVPVFLAHHIPLGRLVAILLVKVLVGIVVGFAVDFALRALHRAGDGHAHIRELCERAHCHCGDIEGDQARQASDDGWGQTECAAYHGHGHDGKRFRLWHIVRSALVHTAEVTAFIFVITLAFGLLIEIIGSDALAGFFRAFPTLSVLVAALVGLIPNCGASVLIAELFLDGTLGTGPMLAGLLVSGGVGLLVLFRTNVDLRQNIIIMSFVYAVGIVVGVLADAMGLVL